MRAGETALNVQRLEYFSDAVMAIAMTMLMVELRPPELGLGLWTQLWSMSPHFLACANSFLVIGVLWLNHHSLFHFLKRADRKAAVLNLGFLMMIAFIPFATALLGHHPLEQAAVIFYGLSLALTGLFYNLLWFFVAKTYIVPEALMTRAQLRSAKVWTLGYPLLYLASTAFAFIDTRVSILAFLFISLFYVLPSSVDSQLKCFGNVRRSTE